jgi:hypothetical protein
MTEKERSAPHQKGRKLGELGDTISNNISPVKFLNVLSVTTIGTTFPFSISGTLFWTIMLAIVLAFYIRRLARYIWRRIHVVK